ncbi:MAG: DUF5711 family protein [Eubacteriales bacterium]
MANLASGSTGSSASGKDLRVAGKIPPRVNRYYKKVAGIYKACGVVLLVGLAAFLLTVTMFFSDSVTYENLRYLARDFDAMLSSETEGFSTIVYNGSASMKFASFKNGLAAASGDKFLYFDATGIQMIEEDSGCSAPVLVPGDKYLLLYDLGGTSYSVYNQLTRIIRREADNKILTGDMSDSGAFLLVTRSRETRYVVEVYSAAFRHTMSIYKENYVLDAAISPDGESILIASAIPDDTDFCCEVAFCRVGQAEAVNTLTYTHTMPLDACTTEEGFLLLCDTCLYFYDYDGNLTGTVPLSGVTLSYADESGRTVAVVGSVSALGTESRVLVLNAAGETLLDTVVEDVRVTGVRASRNPEQALVYLETPEGCLQIRPDGTRDAYDAGDADVIALVPVANGAILCTKTSAYPVFAD